MRLTGSLRGGVERAESATPASGLLHLLFLRAVYQWNLLCLPLRVILLLCCFLIMFLNEKLRKIHGDEPPRAKKHKQLEKKAATTSKIS